MGSAPMIYRGKWEYCPEYNRGEVVFHNGVMYLALRQSAGKYPHEPENTAYWRAFGGGGGGDDWTNIHNLLYEIQGGTEYERYHLTEEGAKAAESIVDFGAITNIMVIITQQDVNRGYFDITGDVIDPRKIEKTVVFLNTDAQYYGYDYVAGNDDKMETKRIFFRGLGLDEIPIAAGDKVWVFYHSGKGDEAQPPGGDFWDTLNEVIGNAGVPFDSLNETIAGPFSSLNDIVIGG